MKTYALTLIALTAGICFGICVGELSLAERRIDVLEVKRWMIFHAVVVVWMVTEIIIRGLTRNGDDDDSD